MLANAFPNLHNLRMDAVAVEDDHVAITAIAVATTASCPLCGCPSRSIHSRRRRVVADVPICGVTIVLTVLVRRFFCRESCCPRRIVAGRLPVLVASGARHSHGLRAALQRIGLTSGGEAGARLARSLGMPTSPDTVLRLIRAATMTTEEPPCIVGIDDWASKRGCIYGTIVCDLERHRVLALLPDRSADSTATWFAGRPTIQVIARDRAGLYADSTSRGASQAMQVADRWHLIDNLADARERFLLHKRAVLKETAAVAVAVQPPAEQPPVDEMYQGKRRHPPAQAWMERVEEESERRLATRRAAYEAVVDLQGKGADIADIARTVGVSRTTVYRYLREGPPQRTCPARHGRQRVLEPWEPYLLQRWAEGYHTAMRRWREIREQGFAHSVTNVQRFVAQIRREGPAPIAKVRSPFASARGPSPRRVTSLLLQRVERRTTEGAAYVDRLCQADAAIKAAHALAQDFLTMVRERRGERLDAWMEQAEWSEVVDLRRFAAGLRGDVAAVRADLTVEHSNGQTEGQINRLKLIRRTMYGRGNVDLVHQRVLRAG